MAKMMHISVSLFFSFFSKKNLADVEGGEHFDLCVVLGNNVLARDAKIHVALGHVGGNVGGRQKDQRHRQPLAAGNIEPRQPRVLQARTLNMPNEDTESKKKKKRRRRRRKKK